MSDADAPNTGDAPNLDLIGMVQRARLAHDADALPSQMTGVYWVECKRPTPDPAPTARAAAFTVRLTLDQLDAVWVAVRDATRRGELGYKSKAATASRGLQADRLDRQIVVAVYDAADTADVARTRAALLALLAPFGLTAEAVTFG